MATKKTNPEAGGKAEQLQFGDTRETVALRRVWASALKRLAREISKPVYVSYVKTIRPLKFTPQEVLLGIQSTFALHYLKARYDEAIRKALEASVGHAIQVRYHVLTDDERVQHGDAPAVAEPQAPLDAAAPPPAARDANPARKQKSFAGPDWVGEMALNPSYTLERLVVGAGNQMAVAAAEAVAMTPGAVYNPLFLHGRPGLGKTHLLHAIGHEARKHNPELRVGYVDGESFSYHYVSALREHKLETFRDYCDGVDLWLVDDIQFIAADAQAREEFFHVFYRLYQGARQVVIASDRSPHEFKTLDERIRTRFEGGLIVNVAAPDLETRMAILERRCKDEGWKAPPEVIYFLANEIRSNVRTLHGALRKLIAYSQIMKAPVSVSLAQSELGEYLVEKPIPHLLPKGVPMEAVVAASAQQFGLTVEELRGPRRDNRAVTARQVAMLLGRHMTSCTLLEIGSAVGGRDHATVKRGIQKTERLLDTDTNLRSAVQQVRERLDR